MGTCALRIAYALAAALPVDPEAERRIERYLAERAPRRVKTPITKRASPEGR